MNNCDILDIGNITGLGMGWYYINRADVSLEAFTPLSTPPKYLPIALSSNFIQLVPLPTTLSTLAA